MNRQEKLFNKRK